MRIYAPFVTLHTNSDEKLIMQQSEDMNGQWYVFYHRQTGTDEYARQAMVAPIDVKVEEGKHAIFFKFKSDTKEKSLCSLSEFYFTFEAND